MEYTTYYNQALNDYCSLELLPTINSKYYHAQAIGVKS